MQEALSYLQSQVDSPADLRLGNLRDSTCNACELPYVLQQRRAGKIHVLEFVLCEAFSYIETAPATPASCRTYGSVGKIHVLEFVLCEAFSYIETAPATPASCVRTAA